MLAFVTLYETWTVVPEYVITQKNRIYRVDFMTHEFTVKTIEMAPKP